MTEQAAYLAAKSMRDTAELDLEHTAVRAPFDGIASKVPMRGPIRRAGRRRDERRRRPASMWIEANYKETDLTHVTSGQAVTIELDTYPDHEWRGNVQSISQATGAEFSVMPPQNATGNWVKVIQRIPVRIAIDMQRGRSRAARRHERRRRDRHGPRAEAPAFLTLAAAGPRALVATVTAANGAQDRPTDERRRAPR